MQISNCLSCKKEFKYYPCEGGIYCSKSCANKISATIRHKNKPFGFGKGYHPLTEFKKSDIRITGKNNSSWKGDNVGLTALHDWVKRKLGKATECVSCNDTLNAKRFEWANVSGEYKRNLEDWIMLCSICHRKHDNNTIKGWITRRRINL